MRKQLFEKSRFTLILLSVLFVFLLTGSNIYGQCSAPPVYTSIGGNSAVLCEGGTMTPFTLNFTGATSFQWQRSPITGTPTYTNVPGQTTNTLSLSNVAKADEGLYRLVATNACGSTNSNNTFQLQVRLKPFITTNPVASKSVCQGTTLSLSVGVGGNALSLTWFKDDVPISGQPTINLSVSNFQASNVGNYHAVVQPLSECAGFTATSSKSSVSLATNIAFATQPPASQNICAGSNLVLAPTITGTATAYQWKKGGGNIAGQTNPTYSANNVNSLTAGNYSVVITGACNTLTSGNYEVIVNSLPSFTTSPINATKNVGETQTFTATATGTISSYKWQKGDTELSDGGNISGSATNSLTLSNLSLTDAGQYKVKAFGTGVCLSQSVTSNVATLTVTDKPSPPSITAPTTLSVCQPNSLTLTASCPTGTVIWSNNTTGTSLTILAVGTYAISAKCSENGKESDASNATNLEIKAKPSSPTVTPPTTLSVCEPSNLTLTASCSTGTVVWSNSATGNTLTVSAVGTYAISAKCLSNGCESEASSSTNLEIKAKPSSPTVTPPTNLVVCQPNNLTLTASCSTGTVVWSNSATGNTLTVSAVGTYAFSAKCISNGCESEASSSTNLEIKAKPSSPTVIPPTNLVVCQPNNLTLTASCSTGTVVWSNSATGNTLTVSAVGTYAISAKCLSNGCESEASSSINLEIKAKPSSPTITPPTNLVVCQPNNLTLTASCSTGTVVWSNSATGNTLTVSAVGTYAFSAKCISNGCESEASSSTNLEIKAKPSSPTVIPPTTLSVCQPNNLTLTASCSTGTVVWSNSATGNTLTVSAVGTYAFSAKCISNGCESEASSSTNLEIKEKPSSPTVSPTTNLVVCQSSSLTLTASCSTGTVVWSNSATGNTLTVSAVGTYTISAKCLSNGCESEASSSTNLEIKAKPTSPTITPPTNLSVCEPTNLTLTASCSTGTVVWSNSATGNTLTVSAVGTYAISAKCISNGCESEASSSINLEIKAKPSSPTVTPPTTLNVCQPNNLTLTASCSTGTVVWSNSATGNTLTISAVGTYAISAKCLSNGCESEASSSTNLEIKAKPSSPTVIPPTTLSVCQPNNLTLTASCSTGTVVWSNSATGNTLTVSAVGTYAISAKCISNGCESEASSTTNLEIKEKPASPTITPPTTLSVCQPNNLTLTASCSTGTVVWSNSATGNTLTVSAVGTYAISAKCLSNGCESEASSSTNLEIKALPNTQASNTGPYEIASTIQLNASEGISYSWAGPNGFSSIQQNPSIFNAQPSKGGIYTISVTNQSGCVGVATTLVTINTPDPCTQILRYSYVLSGNPHQYLFALTDGVSINQNTKPTSILVRPVCSRIPVESVTMILSNGTRTWETLQNIEPYAIFDNEGTAIRGEILPAGTYTLTVTGYSQDNKQGNLVYGPIVTTFTIVGNASTISQAIISKTELCAGSTFEVAFTTTGNFSNENLFQVILSDKNGKFDNSQVIGTNNTTNNIICTIPLNIEYGETYRIKIISIAPFVDGIINAIPLKIHPKDLSLTSPKNDVSFGTSVQKATDTITATNNHTGEARISYQAGKSIIFLPGFNVSNVSPVFKAEIKTCE